MKSPIALLNSLLDDYQRLNPGVKGLKRDLVTLEKRFENEGFSFLSKALPALDEALLLGLSSGKFTCPLGFKTTKGGTIPALFSGMFCEVFDPLTGVLKDASLDIGILGCLHGILRIFKKTQVSAEDEEYLHQIAVNEFYQCDERANKVAIPDRHDHHIGRVCKLILNTLKSKDIENGNYKNGPGAVKEGYKGNEKYSALLEAAWEGSFNLEQYGIWGLHESGLLALRTPCKDQGEQRIPSAIAERTLCTPKRTVPSKSTQRRLERSRSLQSIKCRLSIAHNRASSSIAKLISVAKNSTSRRTITVEPLLKQFIQQGLNTILREAISECSILSSCLALTDQEENQKLALEGSQYDNWATIDLKSASDLLSLRLVKLVFGHYDEFLHHMIECRTPFVEAKSKSRLELGKFAGMGNALTFPVQSVCFAVVCIAAILDQDGHSPSYWRTRRAARRIRIFGDDIIIEKRYVHQCVTWLQEVGLQVNFKKSFLEGNFKESCGVDAFRGVDITPHYVKHQPGYAEATPSIIAGWVEMSNHLWLACLYSASTWFKNEVENALRKRLPLVSQTSGLLGWHSRLDAMTPHKWCRNTQQFLTRSVALAPVKRKDKLDGYAALFKCLITKQLDLNGLRRGCKESERNLFPEPMAQDLDHLDSTSMRYNNRIVRRWVPTLVGTESRDM